MVTIGTGVWRGVESYRLVWHTAREESDTERPSIPSPGDTAKVQWRRQRSGQSAQLCAIRCMDTEGVCTGRHVYLNKGERDPPPTPRRVEAGIRRPASFLPLNPPHKNPGSSRAKRAHPSRQHAPSRSYRSPPSYKGLWDVAPERVAARHTGPDAKCRIRGHGRCSLPLLSTGRIWGGGRTAQVEALLLEALDDLADQAALNAVRPAQGNGRRVSGGAHRTPPSNIPRSETGRFAMGPGTQAHLIMM